eukprot:4143760-Prymnesium_polylepis.1
MLMFNVLRETRDGLAWATKRLHCEYVTGNGRYVGQRPGTRVQPGFSQPSGHVSCSCTQRRDCDHAATMGASGDVAYDARWALDPRRRRAASWWPDCAA